MNTERQLLSLVVHKYGVAKDVYRASSNRRKEDLRMRSSVLAVTHEELKQWKGVMEDEAKRSESKETSTHSGVEPHKRGSE